jgi:MFS family permease
MKSRLPANVIALGWVSLLMAMSSQMIHGLLPLFLVTVLGASAGSIGVIEGVAEATNSLARLFSGAASDWLGRRKPLVVIGYGLAALSKPLFPLAGDAGTVLLARFFDRSGKGIRDAPRDALLADELAAGVRGSGFGLRLTFYTVGSMLGPLIASALMLSGGGDIRLVFWIAVIPALLSVAALVLFVQEPRAEARGAVRKPVPVLRGARELPVLFWWVVAIAALLELARFSQAFLLLKAKDVGVEPALIPLFLVLMSAVYGLTAYPCGVLADRVDRRLQLAAGAAILLASHVVLAIADTALGGAAGAALWGLQMGVTQGLLAATIAEAAPAHLRGTAFGLYYLVDGIVSLLASSAAGGLWMLGGASATFSAGATLSAIALLMLLVAPLRGAAACTPRLG